MSSISCCCCFSLPRRPERQPLIPADSTVFEADGIRIALPPDLISRESFAVQPLDRRPYRDWNEETHRKVFSCIRRLLTFTSEKRADVCIVGRQTERAGFFYDVVVNPSEDTIALLAKALLGGDPQSVEEQKERTRQYSDTLYQVRVSEYTEIPIHRSSEYDRSTYVTTYGDIEVHFPKRALSQYHFVIVSHFKELSDISEGVFLQIEHTSQRINELYRSIFPEKETIMFYDSHGDKHLVFVNIPTGCFKEKKIKKYLSEPPNDLNPQATARGIQRCLRSVIV